MGRPGTWVILAAVIAALAISGPFGTLDTLRFLPRLAYWSAVVLATVFSGWLVSQSIVFALATRGASRAWQWLAASAAVSLVAVVEVGVLNAPVFGQSLLEPAVFGELLLSTVPIALLVTAAFTWGRRPEPEVPAARVQAAPPRLLARLPLDKRGALVTLTVQDHYVEVVTTRGHELLLLRLGDAIAETEGCPGLQVHRSHWVALDQVRAARRDGARGVLTMADGREIPVSRGYLPQAKRAGLF